MKGLKRFPSLITISATILAISVLSVKGQIGTPCTSSMISSFTPCISFITGSSSNGSSPTAGCCDSLKSVMSDSMDCGCLIVTGNVPLSLPINRTLAISLPQACQSSGVPIRCKASGAPLPAPGPVLFGPAISPLSPAASSPFSPRASKASALAPQPAAHETTSEITPSSPPVHSVAPTATPGIRPVVSPTSVSDRSYHIPSPYIYILLIFMGIMAF